MLPGHEYLPREFGSCPNHLMRLLGVGEIVGRHIFSQNHLDQAALKSPVVFRRWDSAVVPDLFFLETTEHDIFYGDHVHDAMEVLWIRSGFFELAYRGTRYPMHGGDAIIIAPNEVHAGGPCNRSRFRFATLHIPRKLMETRFDLGDFGGSDRRPLAPVHFLSGLLAERLYQQLIRGLPTTVSLADQTACLGDALHGLFWRSALLTQIAVPQLTHHPAVQRVRTAINHMYTETVDMGSLATEAGLHPRYLIELFNKVVGLPPHQYQIAQRVEFARRLLDDELSLSAVASTAGFSDQSHFYRHFKRTYCMTPAAYRDHTIPL